jgi:glycosyltransferase involved in cell wall biosynthesis
LKILLIHSYYQQKGGEDGVFEQESELLRQSEEVSALALHNLSGWKGAFQFLFSIWNFGAVKKIRKQIEQNRPDIIQLYNWHYATGPVVIRLAANLGIPVAMNLQNYRLLCPSGTLLFKGQLFTESIEKRGFPWKAVYNRVYRNSFFQTFWLAFIVWFHKISGTWSKVDLFIAPTNTVKKLFTETNNYLDLPPDKFIVKPNFSIQKETLALKRNNRFLFVGRLSQEKGIEMLLTAFKESSHELIIAGSGPLLSLVEETCATHKNIRYAGNLDREAVKNLMSSSSAFVFTSIWYEPFGLVITEALSNGCPLIASDIGSPAELVQNGITGIHFKAGDPESLRNCLDRWNSLSDLEKKRYSENGMFIYKQLYTPEKNREQLLTAYKTLIGK